MARMMSFLANRTGAEIPAAVNIDPSRDGHRRQPISLRSFGGEAARGLIGREGLISAVIAEEFARGSFDDDPLASAFFCHVEKLYTSETPHPKPGGGTYDPWRRLGIRSCSEPRRVSRLRSRYPLR